MPTPNLIAKASLVLLFKLFLLSLVAPFLVVSNMMFLSPFLLLAFYWPPFLYASAALITCCSLIAWRTRDWGPLAWSFATIAAAGVFYLHQPAMPERGAEWVLTALSIPAAINFLYRNRLTEPLVIFSALIVLSFAFTDILCPVALLLWAHFSAGYPLGLKDVWTTLESFGSLLVVAPAALLYWLGKHSYAPLLARLNALFRRHST